MPRLPIDYTRAVIYKIVCRDVSLTETYVGSTTHLTSRKSAHKCNNPKDKRYNMSLYQFIRDNEGFENFDVVLVESVVGCTSSWELRARERYWVDTLHAKLNKNIPNRTQNENRDKRNNLCKPRKT